MFRSGFVGSVRIWLVRGCRRWFLERAAVDLGSSFWVRGGGAPDFDDLRCLHHVEFVKIYTSRIYKDKDVEQTKLDESVGKVLFDMENTYQEFISDMKDFYVISEVLVDVFGNR